MGSPSLSLDLSFGARVDVDISCSVPTLVISHPHSSHSESADEVLENKTLKPLPAAPIALIHLQSSPSLLYCPSASALPLAFRRFPVKGPKVRRQGFLCVCADASLHIFYLDDSLAWKSLSTSLVSTEGSSEQPFLDDSMDGSATAIAYTTSPPDVPIDSCAVQLDENNIVLVAIKEKLGLVVYTVQITISDSTMRTLSIAKVNTSRPPTQYTFTTASSIAYVLDSDSPTDHEHLLTVMALTGGEWVRLNAIKVSGVSFLGTYTSPVMSTTSSGSALERKAYILIGHINGSVTLRDAKLNMVKTMAHLNEFPKNLIPSRAPWESESSSTVSVATPIFNDVNGALDLRVKSADMDPSCSNQLKGATTASSMLYHIKDPVIKILASPNGFVFYKSTSLGKTFVAEISPNPDTIDVPVLARCLLLAIFRDESLDDILQVLRQKSGDIVAKCLYFASLMYSALLRRQPIHSTYPVVTLTTSAHESTLMSLHLQLCPPLSEIQRKNAYMLIQIQRITETLVGITDSPSDTCDILNSICSDESQIDDISKDSLPACMRIQTSLLLPVIGMVQWAAETLLYLIRNFYVLFQVRRRARDPTLTTPSHLLFILHTPTRQSLIHLLILIRAFRQNLKIKFTPLQKTLSSAIPTAKPALVNELRSLQYMDLAIVHRKLSFLDISAWLVDVGKIISSLDTDDSSAASLLFTSRVPMHKRSLYEPAMVKIKASFLKWVGKMIVVPSNILALNSSTTSASNAAAGSGATGPSATASGEKDTHVDAAQVFTTQSIMNGDSRWLEIGKLDHRRPPSKTDVLSLKGLERTRSLGLNLNPDPCRKSVTKTCGSCHRSTLNLPARSQPPLVESLNMAPVVTANWDYVYRTMTHRCICGGTWKIPAL